MHYFKGPDILLMDTLKIGKKNLEGQSIIPGSGHLFNRKQMPSNYLIAKHTNLVLQQKSFKKSLIISQNIKKKKKGDQSWVFIGRTDAKAETPILWPPHALMGSLSSPASCLS